MCTILACTHTAKSKEELVNADAYSVTNLVPITIALKIDRNPGSSVFLAGQKIGIAPFNYTLQLEKQQERRTRPVSQWESNPGLSVFLSIMTYGVWVPIAAVPMGKTTYMRDTGVFVPENFDLTFRNDVTSDIIESLSIEVKNLDTIHIQ